MSYKVRSFSDFYHGPRKARMETGLTHNCGALDCSERISIKLLMCKKHWHMIPVRIRSMMWKHWSAGKPTAQFHYWSFKGVLFVAEKENKTEHQLYIAAKAYTQRCEALPRARPTP